MCRYRVVLRIVQDVRYGWRVAVKNPGFTLVAVATLAVGIAANATVFSWIDNVLLRPLPGAAGPERLVTLETRTVNGAYLTTSYADYRDLRDNLKLVDGVAVAQPRAFNVGEPESSTRVWGELVSGNYFAVLGVKPIIGRVFSAEEYGEKQGAYPVVVIGEGLWDHLFHRDPSAIGRTVRVNRQQLTVVGVVPAEFRGIIPGVAFEMWAPAMMGTALNLMPGWMMADRGTRSFIVVARLKPGVTIESANAEAAAVSAKLATMYAIDRGVTSEIMPVAKGHFGAQSLLTRPLEILMAVCGLVLLIVCANLANLLLARSSARRKEFGLRLALGAGRGRVVRQILTESLILVALGGLAAVPLVAWIVYGFGYLVPAGTLPLQVGIQVNADVVVFTVLLCAAACLASGLAPALQTTRADLNRVLAEGGRSGAAGARSQRLRGVLVAAEVALALVAVVGAGLFARSFQIASRIDPGFDPSHAVATHLYLSSAGYKVPERKLFCRRLRERLQTAPGVVSVAYADMLPMGFDAGPWEDLEIQGYVPAPGENMKIYRDLVSPGFLETMRIPLLEGRDFTDRDDEQSTPVMIVNQSFVRRYFGGGPVLGRKVKGWGRWFTVVGVARDAKYRTPDELPQPYFYAAFRQVYREDLAIAFVVRTQGDPRQATGMLRQEINGMDPNVGVFDTMPLGEFISASLFPNRIGAVFLGGLGIIAVLLAAVGLYSVMAYAISQRTAEIGVRMALGASPAAVVTMVLREGLTLAAVGLAFGFGAAFAVTRAASGLLVRVSATDPVIFFAAGFFLALVAVAASVLPALRATRIDPVTALRAE